MTTYLPNLVATKTLLTEEGWLEEEFSLTPPIKTPISYLVTYKLFKTFLHVLPSKKNPKNPWPSMVENQYNHFTASSS